MEGVLEASIGNKLVWLSSVNYGPFVEVSAVDWIFSGWGSYQLATSGVMRIFTSPNRRYVRKLPGEGRSVALCRSI